MNFRRNAAHILRKAIFTAFAACILLLPPGRAEGIEQIQTRYYTIVFEPGGGFIAGEIAKFCDEIYEKLLARYQSFNSDPRVTCIVTDDADFANGYAQYFQNTITIYATSLDFELRGQTNWLRNVFVHEMTHMVALKKSARGPVNYFLLGTGRYNTNPDFDFTILLAHLSQPSWFSEGSAQLGAETYGADRWDTHRDMLLRTAWLEGSLLSFEEMSTLEGKKGMDAEMVYNQGYSLVRYIKEKYGYDRLVKLNNALTLFDFRPSIERVLEVKPKKLYEDWRASLDERYRPFRDRTAVEGKKVADEGSTDYRPAVSPDGRWLAWISNRGRDYAITDLLLKDLSTGKTRVISGRVDHAPSWSHDSRLIVYSKRPAAGSVFYDIHVFDVAAERETRISKNLRALDPSFSPGDSLIVFVRNSGGSNTIGVISADGTGLRYLTSARDGTQFTTPSFSPDGAKVLFGVFRQNLDRDIGLIEMGEKSWRYRWNLADSVKGFSDSTLFAGDSHFRLLLGSKADERDPRFLPDGSGIVFASDRTGVFNLYTLDFATERTKRITDVPGGAFCPSPGPGGVIYYAGFRARDFSILKIDSPSAVEETAPERESRNYLTQEKPLDLEKYFGVQPYQTRRILDAVVPTLYVGPSFIGSRFGLNVVNVGAMVYISDVLGQDALAISGSIGKNLKEDVSLNNDVEVTFERRMAPLTSSRYTHAPSFYLNASRSVINNHIARYEGYADTLFYGDIPGTDYENVLNDLLKKYTVADLYRDEFQRARAGIQIPLKPRHFLSVEAAVRRYSETLRRSERLDDFSTYIQYGMDITKNVPGAGGVRTADTKFFSEMEYFRSREFTLSYFYSRFSPYADSDISPKGTAALFQFRHMRADVTDSLVTQPEYLLPAALALDDQGNLLFYYDTYQPDKLLDALRPMKRKIDLNEFLMYGSGNYRLPWLGHEFGSLVLIGYRDLRLKDSRKGEGSGYDWPLKYYLGGEYTLPGYPYFTFWGSKMLLGRLSYTVPILRDIGSDIGGVQVQRLYGSAFFDAGCTWNFPKLGMNPLRRASIKRDAGLELRLKSVLFYRFDGIAYVKIAWPLDDTGSPEFPRDARRYYFGLRM